MSLAFLFEHADIIISELKLVTATLSVIYVASHASLRRPASAEPSKKKSSHKSKDASPDDDEEEEPPRVEGLQTSDAILLPVVAAIVLTGLYYLIQYLQDPQIINKILQWYISLSSVASFVILYSHGLQLLISTVFPRYWRAGETVYRICQRTRRQRIWKKGQDAKDQKAVATAMGPLPVASSAVRLPAWAEKGLWGARELLTEEWSVEAKIHGLAHEKTRVRFHHAVAPLLSVATIMSYHIWRSSFFTNLIGLAFCYMSGQLLSPNSFKTAFCILGGLFVYDIVMVFYTPYMVTVATTVDAPMKLIVETGGRTNILGLGDVAVPCMLIALALRFDLWMHYQAKVKQIPDTKGSNGGSESVSNESDSDEGWKLVRGSKGRHVQVRAPYIDVTGRWADWLHTSSFPWESRAVLPKEVTAAAFPKPYFYAAMGGYAVGLVVAMALSVIFKHGQPALLYLVPGIIGALCLTAMLRGEVRYMMAYNEDGRLDLACGIVELDERGKLVRFVLEDEKKEDEKGASKDNEKGDEKGSEGGEGGEEGGKGVDKQGGGGGGKGSESGDSGGQKRFEDVFLIRVSAPRVEVISEEVSAEESSEISRVEILEADSAEESAEGIIAEKMREGTRPVC